jgi:hypothetical protein
MAPVVAVHRQRNLIADLYIRHAGDPIVDAGHSFVER